MKRIFNSVSFALSGIRFGLNRDYNFKLHLLLSTIVILLGFCFSISKAEWIAIIFCIGINFAAELLNSAIEQLCDILHPGYHKGIGRVKDMAAGTVLVITCTSVVVEAVVFIPHLFNHFH